jgi:hypothetical protein
VLDNITTSEVEEPSSPTNPKKVMMDLDDIIIDVEETTSLGTPRSKTGLADKNQTPMKLGSIEYIWNNWKPIHVRVIQKMN